MAEVEFYDYEDELSTAYVDRCIIEPTQVIHDLRKVKPSRANAFLYNKRNSGGINMAFTGIEYSAGSTMVGIKV